MDQLADLSKSEYTNETICLFEEQFTHYNMTIKKINNDIIIIIKYKIDTVFVLFQNANIVIDNNNICIYNICNNYVINEDIIKFENIMIIYIDIRECKKMHYSECQNRLNNEHIAYNLSVLIYDNFRHLPIHKFSSWFLVNNEIEFSLVARCLYIKMKNTLYIGIESFKIFHPEYFITQKLATHDE